MAETPQPRVSALYRYPIKGLSPEPLHEITLGAGETLPFDRAYAIENGPGRFDPAAPKHLPKINFLMLMRDERLAALESKFDDADHTLTILRAGKPVVRGDLRTRLGRQLIEQFFAAYMKTELRGPPKIVAAPGHSFSDVAAKCVHIVNLASVRELERAVGRPVDPLRFRANVYLDGLAPWAEQGWVGAELALGQARLKVFDRTGRCEATNVDPKTGVRDLAIPAVLQRTWGHTNFGIYATATSGAIVYISDPVAVNKTP
ncbi:MAG: MOSC domain-containing protein [Hyphomicrobiaceae bacterium]